MRFKSRSDVALYVWDYFYISHVPHEGDEGAWAAVERATHRIRQSEQYLDAPTPMDVRVRHARRVRNSVRAARRQIEQLSVRPDRWVIDRLDDLEAMADAVIKELGHDASRCGLN